MELHGIQNQNKSLYNITNHKPYFGADDGPVPSIVKTNYVEAFRPEINFMVGTQNHLNLYKIPEGIKNHKPLYVPPSEFSHLGKDALLSLYSLDAPQDSPQKSAPFQVPV
jgi:hypothetical protein